MQLTLDGRGIDEVSIERIRMFEPLEGYYLAFSGGKDSIVILDLAKRSGVRYDAHYSVVGVDPPELVQFIKREHPEVVFDHPKRTMWRLTETNALPTRQNRWCCANLKEAHGNGRFLLTGIRAAESARRKARKMVEVCTDKNKRFLHPIYDWQDADVWQYIRERGLTYCCLYDEGFTRLGCVLCPMRSAQQTAYEITRWPKIAAAWRAAARRYYERGRPAVARWATFEDFWNWWISREGGKADEAQECFVFE
ncbi:MAG: phosphoadenosine phosphosulfate reductase family protein [Deltaproteobacteria bacterium]|nr:phosphoadenosine phosphosulfate reductase family protein [Deltaproteobacteria bacterium]